MEGAPGYIDFLLEEAVRGRDLSAPGGRVDALNDVLPHVARLDNPAERSAYYGRIAEVLGIEDEIVLEQLSKALKAGRSGVSPAASREARESGGPPETEVRLVRSLLESAEARQDILAELTVEEIGEMATGPILGVMRDLHMEGQEPSVPALMDRLPEGSPRELLARIAFQQEPHGDAHEALICVSSMRRERMIHQRRRLQKEIDAAGAAVTESLLRKKMELSKKINELS
jgi:DNA primase